MHFTRRKPELSIVVIAYQMARELGRTLTSLSPQYQRGVAGLDYEVIVVDNGSPVPVDTADVTRSDRRFRLHRIDDAPSSPAHACNLGVQMSSGRNVAVVLDGARIVTPGAVARSLQALQLHRRPVVTTAAWHLGHEHQSISIRNGYGPEVEDALLASIAWPRDGYRLFDIASLAGSNPDGALGTLNESCFLSLPRTLWNEVGGMDTAFDLPGGGLANLDLFTRLVGLPDSQLVILLGEGSFHQVHRGASTKPDVDTGPWYRQYEELRGQPYSRPPISPVYYGALPEPARRWL